MNAQASLPPAPAPLPMPIRDRDTHGSPVPPPRPAGIAGRRAAVAAVSGAIVLALGAAMVVGLAADGFAPSDALILGLYLPNLALNAVAATTAVAGVIWLRRRGRTVSPLPRTRPSGRTAVLVPARNENVRALGARLDALARDLARAGLANDVDIFLLSDSDDPAVIAAEERYASAAVAAGRRPAIHYRRRIRNAGRKPGNIAQWVETRGGAYAYMLLLDADSVMSARRIATMIARMEASPSLALLQSAVSLTGAETRFGRLQQRAGRLYGAPFAAGLAGWTGPEGNYWGHNALIRVEAFAAAAGLPRLPGRAPFGGDILSHDFVEAAWLRRAGWAVEIDPDATGSAEGGPQTLAAFHKRDRRWCQGNLQHLRLIGARGLHPLSRLHLGLGILGYLAAPLWLGLVVAAILAGAVEGMIVPALGAVALILAQKAAGVAHWLRRRPGRWARRIVLRAAAGELALSTLLAPVIMMRQTIAVVSVLTGHDCGWKPPAGSKGAGDAPWLEPAAGAALLLAVSPGLGDAVQALLIAPIVVPLFLAPALVAWLDRRPARREGATLGIAPARSYSVQR